MLRAIETLRQTVNKKWKTEQSDAYQLFLNDLESYIRSYIFTGQVADLNVFYASMNVYGTTTNPLGQ